MRNSNQPPPLENWNLFAADAALASGLAVAGAGWAEPAAKAFGEAMGRPDLIDAGVDANRFPPMLRTHDRYGERIDEVEFHPAWHELLRTSTAAGLHSLPWEDSGPGGHTARAVLFYLASQNEAGHGCPLSMTYASVPTLQAQPDLADRWLPHVINREYRPDNVPAEQKASVLVGMALTERQGGSDVRANVTSADAVASGGPGAEYRINGHKWFCSAPMCDAFLVLAQAPGGISCFLLPRWRPDGSRNGFFIDRLKDKLGNRSNASSEVRFEDATAWLIGEEGRGIPTIIEMVSHTRLDCVIGSAALIRRAATEAAHHARHRLAFGRRLVEQPLMRSVLADLALESEAATGLMLLVAQSFDRVDHTDTGPALRRLITPVAKFWVTKRCTPVVVEALECLGGNGYVEESPMPRLLRESPLNSIWEGSGNVIVLDVLRALQRTPDAREAVAAETADVVGTHAFLDAARERLLGDLSDPPSEAAGREFVARFARTLAAIQLTRHAPGALARAYVESRLGDGEVATLGSLDPSLITGELIDRIMPVA